MLIMDGYLNSGSAGSSSWPSSPPFELSVHMPTSAENLNTGRAQSMSDRGDSRTVYDRGIGLIMIREYVL